MSEIKEIENALDLINTGDFNEAKNILTGIIENDPENIEALKSLGLCNINLNNYDEAYDSFKKVLNTNPDDAVSWFYIGSIYEKRNDLEHAKNAF